MVPTNPDPIPTEYIKHAAILYDGVIYVGRDHSRIINDVMIPMGLRRATHPGLHRKQGFVTSTGRYVDREEAGKIAIAAKQVSHLPHGRELFSEDLNYPENLGCSHPDAPERSEWAWAYTPEESNA